MTFHLDGKPDVVIWKSIDDGVIWKSIDDGVYH